MSNLWEFMWEALPPGFRFHPTDEEFVNHYLRNYIFNIKDAVDVIPIVDDLFKRDPSELPRLFRGSSIISSKDPEWWFLSTLRYKSQKSDKFDRSSSKGSWKITGKPKEIHDRGKNRQIAEMRNLVFCENPRNEETNWVIHEYYLRDISFGLTLRELRKYVLCHLVNRQYDYTETSMNMEVDLEYEERRHEFSEEIIQAKIRSLTEGSPSRATNAPINDPQERYGNLFCLIQVSPVDNTDKMEHLTSTSSGDKDDKLDRLLNYVVFSTDEASSHSNEFDVASLEEQLLEPEVTSLTASNHAVLKENRQASPPGTLEGYVVIDETRGFVEDDFQREEAGEASSLPDSPKTPPIKYSMASRNEHNFKEGKAEGARIVETKPHSLTPEVKRNPITRPQTLRPRAGNEKMPITSSEKSQAGEGCRPPFDCLVNLGAGILLLVLMILWLLRY